MPLREGKQGKHMILVDAERTEIPHIHVHIDISLYDRKSLQVDIVIDSYNKLNSTVKSKGYLTKGKL